MCTCSENQTEWQCHQPATLAKITFSAFNSTHIFVCNFCYAVHVLFTRCSKSIHTINVQIIAEEAYTATQGSVRNISVSHVWKCDWLAALNTDWLWLSNHRATWLAHQFRRLEVAQVRPWCRGDTEETFKSFVIVNKTKSLNHFPFHTGYLTTEISVFHHLLRTWRTHNKRRVLILHGDCCCRYFLVHLFSSLLMKIFSTSLSPFLSL